MPGFNDLHEGQKAWLYEKPEARVRLAIAGVQGGKTEVGCRAFAGLLRKTKRGHFMVVAPTYKLLMVTMLKLEDVLILMSPSRKWIVRRNERDRMYWIDQNQNMIFLRSADNPDALRAPTLDGVFFDECAIVGTSHPFRILRQRVNVKRGPIFLTTTPKGSNWLVREIINPWKSGDSMYHVVNWPSIMNPAFDKAEYERAKKYEDERWVRQEYEGAIDFMGGLVFDEFNENIHTAELKYNPDLPIYWGVDFGWRNPTYIGYWQIYPDQGPNGKIVQLAEVHMTRHTIEEIILHALNSKEPVDYSAYGFPEYACCDPTGRSHQLTSGVSAIDIMMKLGIACVEPDEDWNDKEVRQVAIREMHRYLKAEMIQFDSNKCWHMINSFGLYSTPAQKEGERAIEDPIKDGRSDHCMESAFYFLLGKPFYDNERPSDELYKNLLRTNGSEASRYQEDIGRRDGPESGDDPWDVYN
ncbi:MAG: terminase large subunit domain-containing protein [Thermodesulfobacteriota bacterium]